MMRVTCVKMPSEILEALDELVKKGVFTSRSEAIRLGASLIAFVAEACGEEIGYTRSLAKFIARFRDVVCVDERLRGNPNIMVRTIKVIRLRRQPDTGVIEKHWIRLVTVDDVVTALARAMHGIAFRPHSWKVVIWERPDATWLLAAERLPNGSVEMWLLRFNGWAVDEAFYFGYDPEQIERMKVERRARQG